MRWIAGVLKLFHPGHDVELAGVLRALIDGDACNRSDARIDAAVFEYDEELFHGDVGRDVRKTDALLCRTDIERIVRLRAGCKPFPVDPNCGARVVFVCTSSRNTVEQLRVTADAMGCRFDIHEIKAAVATGDSAFDEISTRTRAAIALLGQWYGHNAKRIYGVNGVRSRLWKPNFVEALEGIKTDLCGGDVGAMCKFMCNSVAAAIAGPNAALFWDGMERLKRDFGISGKSLVTFMCDGVAAAIAGPNAALFWAGVKQLERDFGISGKSLVTFMCDGVAAAIAGPNAALFWDGMKRLKRDVGISDKSMVTFMSGGAAAAIAGPNAALFWTGVERLKRDFGISDKGLVTFMCDGVAAAIAGPNAALFLAGVERLKRDFGISGKSLVTFMCNSVAAAITGPNTELFWDGMERLKRDVGIS